MSVCASCHLPIRWGVSEATGHRMPVNPEPHPMGNLRLTETGGDPQVSVFNTDIARAVRQGGEPLYLSHHATCPFAATYRRGGRR